MERESTHMSAPVASLPFREIYRIVQRWDFPPVHRAVETRSFVIRTRHLWLTLFLIRTGSVSSISHSAARSAAEQGFMVSRLLRSVRHSFVATCRSAVYS